MVSDGCRGGGVCHTPGRECLFWPMPPYYSYYLLLLYSTSIEDSRCWLRTANTLTYGYSKNTRPMHEACEASTNSGQIVYYINICTYNFVFGKYFFASSHHSLREATRKPFINLVSLSHAYHFITYNRSSTHIDNEDTL